MKRIFKNTLVASAVTIMSLSAFAQKKSIDYVYPFIGSSNYGTTNPGPVVPHGMMSVTPFNVLGGKENKTNKGNGWLSTSYTWENSVTIGFAHVNLSGVGCPEMGSLLLMATHGDLDVDFNNYGSKYDNEVATVGYYSNHTTKYDITSEVTATTRTSIARFTMPAGENNILLNLGQGLTNETGASLKKVSETEWEGSKLLGSFCYTANQAVFPIYFVMRVNKVPQRSGYWKMQRPVKEWEQEWNTDAGKYKLYTQYTKDIAGDDIGAWLTYDSDAEEVVEVQMGISFVSIKNARENLNAEQPTFDFEGTLAKAKDRWLDELSVAEVEGGTEDQKTVFYTGLYHALIHPNILQDVNGEFPAYENDEIKTTDKDRYTVFSLWDTYRNVHQLMTLLYPERETDILNTLVDMAKEGGWLPKWELFSRESYTMEGDPSLIILNDAYQKGMRDFDVEFAYEAMKKSALTPSKDNPMRPDNDDYMKYGYVPLRGQFDNSVSHALEYYIADWNLAQLAKSLGKTEDAKLFEKRAMGYKHYYDKEYKSFRPITPDGKFISPFDPSLGQNFEPNPGFHEGSAWNYTFAVPHDVKGMVKMMGGEKNFVNNLQAIFDNGYFDVTNEPDIMYPYLFSEITGEEWRTQKLVRELLDENYTNNPGGLPGNDDAGTLSAWAVFSMMGFYPALPGAPEYTITSPTFDKITLKLDPKFYNNESITISVDKGDNPDAQYIESVWIDGKKLNGYKISHEQLINAKEINFKLK